MLGDLTSSSDVQKLPDLIPFFLIGYPRSGTTALARLINQSDNMSCLSYEGNLLYQLWKVINRVNIFEEPFEDLAVEFKTTAEYNLLERAKQLGTHDTTFSEKAIARLSGGFNEDLATKSPSLIFKGTVKRYFYELSQQASTRIVGDKVPCYIDIPEKLSDAYPRSKVVYIIRDPRAVIHSSLAFSKSKLHLFTAPSSFAMAVSLLIKTGRMKTFSEFLPTDRFLSITHQELLDRPLEVLSKLTDFFGLTPYQELMIRLSNKPKQLTKNWRTEMDPEDISVVESVYAAANIDLPPKTVTKSEGNNWIDRARSIMPLLSCSTQDIAPRATHLKSLFKDESGKNTLALTLGLIAEDYHARTEFDKSHTLYSEALLLRPMDPVMQFRFAELCFDQKLLDRAQELYISTDNSAPTDSYYDFLRAKTFFKLGKIARLRGAHQQSIEFFKHSLRICPQFRQAQSMLIAVEKY